MCIMGCGKKKFRNTPLVNNPVYLIIFSICKYYFCPNWTYFYILTININITCIFGATCLAIIFFTTRGIFIFGGGNKRLRNVTKMYCQCQISHKRRKKECLGKFKFSLNRLKKQILRKPIFVRLQKKKLFTYNQMYYKLFL
jgi:hypothetical protein